MVAASHDTKRTARKTAAETFIALSPDAAFVIDEEGRVIAANDHAAALYACDLRSLLSNPAQMLLAPYESIDCLTHETGAHPSTQLHLRCDGELFLVEVSVRRFDEEGYPLFAITVRDVQRSLDTSGELRQARLALDAAFDCVLMHKPDGTLLYFNDAAAQMYGYSREEFEQIGPWGWTDDEETGLREKRIAQLRGIGALSFVSRTHIRNGDERFMEVNARWVDQPSGAVIVAVSRDVTEKLRVQEMLREMAFHDPLTGLPNRALLDDRLEVALSEARRHGDVLAMAFVDIDDFKTINDTYGHEFGDHVLAALGKRLAHSVREHDTVARMGGDEFVAVFTRLRSPDDGRIAACKLMEAVESPLEVDGRVLAICASCGVAIYEEGDDARSLTMRADLSMYAAKRDPSTSICGPGTSKAED